MTGSEGLHHLLRAAVTMELYTNAEYYASHPYFTQKHTENPGLKMVTPLCFSHQTTGETTDIHEMILKEAKRNVMNNTCVNWMTRVSR